MAVLATIHQPSPKLFKLFDNLVVFSREAEIIYQGNPNDLLKLLLKFGLRCPTFYNISDFLLEVASGDFGIQPVRKLVAHHKKHLTSQVSDELSEVEVTSLQEAAKKANKVNHR